ncbi:MAG TPA: deoxyribodipyrimidine photolyase, partial [Gammaproteobacteria bacterium]|nr:deoxyribodipyrimidine photolyase [Gammaproteobacteria bacterium]
MPKVAIIGAGLAGMQCARALLEGGIEPRLFDKGRGIGGRCATR